MTEAEAGHVGQRAYRFMDNRGLVASPEYAAAYFPSGGQGGDHMRDARPPDFRSACGLCSPHLPWLQNQL
jgi:hypothetical protein